MAIDTVVNINKLVDYPGTREAGIALASAMAIQATRAATRKPLTLLGIVGVLAAGAAVIGTVIVLGYGIRWLGITLEKAFNKKAKA